MSYLFSPFGLDVVLVASLFIESSRPAASLVAIRLFKKEARFVVAFACSDVPLTFTQYAFLENTPRIAEKKGEITAGEVRGVVRVVAAHWQRSILAVTECDKSQD